MVWYLFEIYVKSEESIDKMTKFYNILVNL